MCTVQKKKSNEDLIVAVRTFEIVFKGKIKLASLDHSVFTVCLNEEINFSFVQILGKWSEKERIHQSLGSTCTLVDGP